MKETERMYLCLSQERIIQFQVSRGILCTLETAQTTRPQLLKINHYPLDSAIGFAIMTYPLDSDLSDG